MTHLAAEPSALLPRARAPLSAPLPTLSRPATVERIERTLALLRAHLQPTRRVLEAGEPVYRVGDPLDCLHIVHAGCFKTVNLASDGREQMVGLHFKGDWLGFDAIAPGRHGCDAIAMERAAVWSLSYAGLLRACASAPALLSMLHVAMSREMNRDRDSMLSLCTLPADARVAEFLRGWTEALAERGLRTDCITLRMSRAEIGNYLGMTLETVSRALSRLAREQVIEFNEPGRREIAIPDVGALAGFVQRCLAKPAAASALH